MKRGLSKISVIVLGALCLILVLSFIAYQGMFVHKKIMFEKLGVFANNAIEKIEKYKSKEIISTNFTIKTNVEESDIELTDFLNENNNIEGKLDFNKENLDFSLKANFKSDAKENFKVHYINKDLEKYITMYKGTGDTYYKVEKNNIVKLLTILAKTPSKDRNIEKIFKVISKEVPSNSVYSEKARVTLEEKVADTKRYNISLTDAEFEKVVMETFKKIKKDKNLMVELETELSKKSNGKLKAENIVNNLEEELRIFANSLTEFRMMLDLDSEDNIVNVETLVKYKNEKVKNLKITMLKAKNVEFSLIYKENKDVILTVLNKKLDSEQYNSTICYKDTICNILIKKDKLVTIDYSLKSKKTNEPYGIGNLIITNEKDSYNVLFKYDSVIETKPLNLKLNLEGKKVKAEKIDELEEGFKVQDTTFFPKDVLKEAMKLD